MMRSFRLFVAAVTMLFALSAYAAETEIIKLKDGSRWRGQLNDTVHVEYLQQGVTVSVDGKLTKVEDLYVQVDGTFAGAKAKKTVFKGDIVTMKTLESASGAAMAEPEAGAAGATAAVAAEENALVDKDAPGVFVLPMKGMVGEGFRHQEIVALAEYIDKNYGPGQIIVLDIESGGGLGIEMEKIHLKLKDIRQRHRVVAWIREAISAAAATASNCNEIYFRTTGTLGAMTGFNSGTGQSLKGEELHKWMEAAGRWMEFGGRSKYIAWAMIDDEAMLSYDKDPVTGEVTWHNDTSGQVVLSDAKTNLVFTASTAVDSGFADGVADTNEELAKLLNLPGGKWNEKSDYGRKIAEEWLDTVEEAKERIPLLARRLDYKGAASGGKVMLGNQIKIFEELIRWWDRAFNVCLLMNVPPKEQLERQVEELRRQMRRMN
jgi:ClpP class serine protease